MSASIRFNYVKRDAVQSLMGSQASAERIAAFSKHEADVGFASIQTAGGTFWDSIIRSKRDPWKFLEAIMLPAKEKGIKQSALVRGDCLFGFEPQPFDVQLSMLREMAKMGLNVVQNFNGMNDSRATASVAEAVRVLREEEGFDIHAHGTICIEDNPNITLESCLAHARELIKQGHTGLYLKSASGFVKPEFVGELTAALIDEFGTDIPIDIHIHTTYGQAAAGYTYASREAIKRGASIGLDVQTPALAGSTAHPNVLKMHSLLKADPDPAVRDATPDLNVDALNADMDEQLETRFLFQDMEAEYDPRLLEAMRKARAPGGASSTLRVYSNGQLYDQLKRALGTDDWTDIQIQVYEMQAEIDKMLGSPVQITPYANMTTVQAASCLINKKKGLPLFDRTSMRPETIGYLTGELGKVPEHVDESVLRLAVSMKHDIPEEEIKNPRDYIVPYKGGLEREPDMPKQEVRLKEAGIDNPTDRQKLITATAARDFRGQDKHIHFVEDIANDKLPKFKEPSLPTYAQKYIHQEEFNGNWLHKPVKTAIKITDNKSYKIFEALGGAKKLELMAMKALFLRQLDNDLNVFPEGTEIKRAEWRDNLVNQLRDFYDVYIPQQLAAHGLYKTELQAAWLAVDVEAMLQAVLDKKGRGIYRHFKENMRHTQLQTLSVDAKPVGVEDTRELVA